MVTHDHQDVHNEMDGKQLQMGFRLRTNKDDMHMNTAVETNAKYDLPRRTGHEPDWKWHPNIEFESTCSPKQNPSAAARMEVRCMVGMASIA